MAKTAVVTGASGGIGRATAIELARRGFDVGLIARDRDGLEEVARMVRHEGRSALVLPGDVADASELDLAAEQMMQQFGRIDVWVNCAMVTIFARFEDITPEEYRRVTDVTYHGQVFGTQAALRHMRRRNRGVIVQVGSALAYRSIPLQSAYCGAKHAIVGFTESLRTELMHEGSGIQLAMVHLPAVNTPQFAWARTRLPVQPRPAGKPIAPEVAASAIADAALHPRREIYLGWSTVKAILGDMAAPAYADIRAEETWEGQAGAPIPEREGNLFVPVTDVPRDRGPFAEDAGDGALAVSGTGARLGLGAIALVGAAMLAGLAFAAGRRSNGHYSIARPDY